MVGVSKGGEQDESNVHERVRCHRSQGISMSLVTIIKYHIFMYMC